MNIKYKIGIVVISLVSMFAIGRYTAPEKVKIEKEIVTVTQEEKHQTEQKSSDIDRDRHRETTTVEITRPDGTKEKTTKTIDDSKTEKKITDKETVDSSETTKTVEKEIKEITYNRSGLQIGVMGGMSLFSTPTVPTYGGYVTKNVIGPFSIGLWGLSSGTIGASAGITF